MIIYFKIYKQSSLNYLMFNLPSKKLTYIILKFVLVQNLHHLRQITEIN